MRGRPRNLRYGPSIPPFLPPSVSLSFPSFPPLEVGPVKPAEGSGSAVSSPSGVRKRIWIVRSKAAKKPLVASVFSILKGGVLLN